MESSDDTIKCKQIILAASTNRDEAENLVRIDPEIIHVKNGLGETPLHYLAIENEMNAVDWLRRKGASIDPVNNFGQTPLMECAGIGGLEMCKYLIAHGADVRRISPGGDSCFSLIGTEEGRVETLNYLLSLLSSDEDINRYFDTVDSEMVLCEPSRIADILRQRGLNKRLFDT